MKVTLSLILIFLSHFGYCQTKNTAHSFKEIFDSPDSITLFYLSCIHERRIDPNCNSLPDDIGILSNLQEVFIHEGQLDHLPESIGSLKRLKYINLIRCKFDYEKEICKLQTLDSLEHLGVPSGNLRKIPQCIVSIHSLQSIDLGHNPDLDLFQGVEILTEFPVLNYLDVSGIKNLKRLPETFSKLKSVESLILDYMGDDFDWAFNSTLLGRMSIQNLSLNNSGKISLEDLKVVHTLRKIDLSQSILDSIPQSWDPNLPELTSLNLSRVICLDFKSLVSSLKHLKKLKFLSLKGNNISEFSDVLGDLVSLQELDISGNNLKTLPEAFFKLENLKLLNIGKGMLSTQVINKIKQRLPNCKIIEQTRVIRSVNIELSHRYNLGWN